VLDGRFPEVIGRARVGDPEAFAELWRDAHPMLVRYLRVTAGTHAEDIASQTWLRVIEGLESFQGGEPGFRRWLVTIARNIHVDQLRRAGRRPELLTDDLGELDATGRLAPDAAEVVHERLSTESALTLIGTLPADQAEMVTLRVVVGLDVAEVAAVTGRSPGAVRVAVHRGLRRLRDRIIEQQSVTETESAALTVRDV
jgi:RNA polymerase sigma-70 factor (ECF subfamily)